MRKDSTKKGGSSSSQQNFGDYHKYMQDRNKCAKTAPWKVALQGPSRTSVTTRSTCRTETNAQRQHQERWLFKENFGKCLKFWTDSCAFEEGAAGSPARSRRNTTACIHSLTTIDFLMPFQVCARLALAFSRHF